MFGGIRKATGRLPGLALFKGAVPSAATLIFVVYIFYLGWISLGPEKPVPDEKRQAVAVKGVSMLAEEIRKGRGTISTAVLLHFANDPSDFVTDTLRRTLNSRGILSLKDRTIMEKVRQKLNLTDAGISSRPAALKAARGSGTAGILWGVVEKYESSPQGALLKCRWELLDARTGAVRISGIIDEDLSRKTPGPKADGEKKKNDSRKSEFPSSTLPLPLRIAGFLLCMFMLPLMIFSFIRCQIAKNSNRVNAMLLGLLTVLDLLFAYFMVSSAFMTPAGVFLFLGAAAASLLYNTAMLRFAKKLES